MIRERLEAAARRSLARQSRGFGFIRRRLYPAVVTYDRLRDEAWNRKRKRFDARYARREKRLSYRRGLRLYSAFISRGSLCFDVGAHEGTRTRVFRALGARVVAIEPQPDCARRLRRMFEHDEEVRVIEKGVAESEGRRGLTLSPDHTGIATMAAHWKERFPDARWGSEIDVEVITLDQLVSEFGTPHFCKIDVEGLEGAVLAGLSRPIPALSFEFTGLFLNDVVAHLEYLQTLGEIRVNCSLYESMSWCFEEWLRPDELMVSLRPHAASDRVLSGDVYVVFPAELEPVRATALGLRDS